MELLTKAVYSDQVTRREEENLRLAYEAACESVVLLKNDGTLPLRTRKVAMYGAGARKTLKGGTGSGEVNERHAVSLWEGMKDRGFEITSERWLDDYDACFDAALAAYKQERKNKMSIFKLSSIMELMGDDFRFPGGRAITREDVEQSGTDVCIYVLSRQAGEGGDRRLEEGDYYLTGDERRAISFCAAHYEQFVLIINSGTPIDMGFLEEIDGINAVIFMSQLGSEGGHALADILSGAVTPSGKLADTWAKRYEDIPFAGEYSYLNGDLEDENYREGIYVGYRYFDSFDVAPAFPFGFGLSYTDFSIRVDQVRVNGREVELETLVTNEGTKYAGKEVLQLYVSAPSGALDKEYQALAAFEKTQLLVPGASETVTLRFDLGSMASYRAEDSCSVLEAGEYILRLGNSSRNTAPVAVVNLPREVVVSRHTSVCPLQAELEELKAPAHGEEPLPDCVARLTMDPAVFETVEFEYAEPEICAEQRVADFMQTLSCKDMAEIVVGIGMFGGKTRFTLPGSVGNTTSKFWDRGLANIALCDGPAGLRVQRRSTVNEKGKVKPVEMAMSAFDLLPGIVKNIMTGDPEKDTVLYQFTTAFPVESALAQSWNTELLYRIGGAVYREMKEYGCTFWLAPAVNIHRNPLCGRHFEYFSEDPRLTGTMSAALTRGVQQENGYYVTVKHYACNNQEQNRSRVSSNVSERALREIYLKAFEISVREGGAKGIMTSYNRVNGVYTPNSHDLCTKVLRCEWGFDGVVMTDWFSTSAGKGDNAVAMQAGNDLIMPGTKAAKKEILKGVRSGRISKEDLRRCCANVIRAILDSATQREYIG